MRTKLFLIACVAIVICITSCNEGKSSNKIEAALMEYVETEFDDQDNFIEITKFEKPDTFCADQLLELAEIADTYKDCFSKYTQAEYKLRREKLIKEQPFFIIHQIKARVKVDKDEKRIQEFYVLEEKDGTLKVYDHDPEVEEVNETYADFAKTVEGMMGIIMKAIEIKKNQGI